MMQASNDNNRQPFRCLDALPLFADDKAIATAIVGRANAEYWLSVVLPELERCGFPAKDPLHGGRAVPLVMRFYDDYLGMTEGVARAKPDGEEKLGTWSKKQAA